MSNDGLVTKTFISSGIYSEKALTNFTNDWDHDFVETIYVLQQLSEEASDLKTDTSKLANDLIFMVIDNETTSIGRAINYFNHANQICGGIEITGIILVDVIDSPVSEELTNLQEEVNEITSAYFMQVNHCDPIMIESLLAMYAHLYCGYSINCLEIQDLANTLKSGYYFEAAKVTAKTDFELPFAAYQAIQNISMTTNKLFELEGIALVIIANEHLPNLSLLSACQDILLGFANKDLKIAIHTNVQPGNALAIHLGAVFQKRSAREKANEKSANHPTLDMPDFLKKY